jgi:hypothetical protein
MTGIDRAMSTKDAWNMVRGRAKDAGIRTATGCHTSRATGITDDLENGGTREEARQMAVHGSAQTTSSESPADVSGMVLRLPVAMFRGWFCWTRPRGRPIV